jgi:hypothetical protein
MAVGGEGDKKAKTLGKVPRIPRAVEDLQEIPSWHVYPGQDTNFTVILTTVPYVVVRYV